MEGWIENGAATINSYAFPYPFLKAVANFLQTQERITQLPIRRKKDARNYDTIFTIIPDTPYVCTGGACHFSNQFETFFHILSPLFIFFQKAFRTSHVCHPDESMHSPHFFHFHIYQNFLLIISMPYFLTICFLWPVHSIFY